MLYSLRAEGCPRLVLEMIRADTGHPNSQRQVATISGDFKDLEPAFRELNVNLHTLGWRRHGYLRLARDTGRLLDFIRPDGIICYTLGMHVPVSFAAWRRNIPTVVHIGTAPPIAVPSVVRKIRLQLAVGNPFVRTYAACSDHVREAVIDIYRLPASRVVTVPNGVNLEFFAGARRPRKPDARSSIVIGMVASLEISKDHETLLQAIALLKQRGCDVHLRLIGDGQLRGRLAERCRELDIAGRVQFLGSVSDVRAELSRLDVFAYSASDEEGLGIALVEALAAGVPCVASDVGATREVLENGRLGHLVPARDPARLAGALLQALTDAPAPLASLARYDVRQTARAYRELLFGRAARNVS